MLVFDGDWADLLRRRPPIDRSVYDAETATLHEYRAHINKATDAVIPMMLELEGRSFSSEAECNLNYARNEADPPDLMWRD